jgi:hypothetical protein
MANQFEIPGLKEALTQMEKYQDAVNKAAKSTLELAIEGERASKAITGTGLKQNIELTKTAKTETDKLEAAKERLNKLQGEEAKEIAKVNLLISEQIQKNKAVAASESENATALQKLNAQINASTKASKELGAQMVLLSQEGKKNTAEYKQVEEAFIEASNASKKLNDSYRDISKSAGDNRALVGSYSQELQSHFDTLGNGVANLKGSIANGDIVGTFNSARTVIQGFGQAVKTGTDETKGVNDELGKSGGVVSSLSEKFRFGAKCTVDFFKPSEENSKKLVDGLERVKIGFTGNTEAINGATESTKKGNLATQLWARTQLIFAGATGVVSGAFNILKIAIASTGIGLLVIALGSLVAYFSQTQAGIEKIDAVIQPLKAVFSALMGVAETLGGALVDAFSNPKKAMNDLYEFVKQNLINRFTAFKVILEGIMELDFKKVTNGVLQAGTGVENMTDKISAASKKTGDFLSEAAKKGAEIARLTKEIDAAQLKYNKNQIAIGDAIDAQLLISKDTSKSFKERAAAAEAIIKITEKNGLEESKILQLKLRQLRIQQELKGAANLTNEEKQKEIDLLLLIDAAEDRGKEARLEQSKVLSGLKKEQREKAEEYHKQELENQKKAAEIAISTMKATLDYQVATYDQSQNLEEDNLAFVETISAMKVKIAEAELKKNLIGIKKGSLEEKSIKQASSDELVKIEVEKNKAIRQIAVEGIEAEMELYDLKNKTLIRDGAVITDLLIAQEAERLNKTFEFKQEELEKKFQVDDAIVRNKYATNQKLTDAEQEYVKTILDLEEKKNAEIKKNDKALLDSKLKATEEEEKVNIRKYRLFQKNTIANNIFQLKEEEKRLRKDRELQKDNAKELEKIDLALAENKKKLAEYTRDSKIKGMQDSLSALIQFVGEESAVGKTAAIAQTTIDTYQGATRALKDYPAPYSYIVAGLTIANGLANVSKIAGISAFAEGTDYAPYTGKAIAHEEGPELQFDKNWNLKSLGSDKGAQLIDITQGDKIIPADISAIIRQTMFRSYGMNANQKEKIDYIEIGNQFGKHAGKIVDAVKRNKSTTSIIVQRNITDRVTFKGKRV